VVERFAARLADFDGTAHVVGDLEAAYAKARELVAGGTVAAWDGLADLGPPAPPADADVSIIRADVGVAMSGAVGFAHGPGRPRAHGLLPDRQIALLDRADIVETLGEALRYFFGSGTPPANVVFAAGPSRTADIEQRMMLGVHAPRSLDVIVFG
jgi:L-lactate dehydrogenase complex protein LldG